MQHSLQRQGAVQNSATICPFISEPEFQLNLEYYPSGKAGRERLITMIETLFAAAYDAKVTDFCEDLVAMETGGQLLGVTGLRRGDPTTQLFSEQYLDAPVDQLISAETGQLAARRHIIEIGNLAVSGRGQTRWLFAVMTAFLHAAGYKWVVCTAISPLISLFRRLGLEPMVLGPADPSRLANDASAWGRYYEQKPQVCFGSIPAGYHKMGAAITPRQPRLQALWLQAQEAGRDYTRQHSGESTAARL